MPDDPMFADEHFMSAAQKKKVLRAWSRFLKSGCAKTQFTEDLYNHLVQHCSFIAHFDRKDFYNFYFEQITTSLFRFFDQFDPEKPGISAEYGGTHWLSKHNTGSDLNHAMREAGGPCLERLRQTFLETRRQRDIGVASSILATYGLAIVPAAAATTPVEVNSDTDSRCATRSVQQALFAR